MIVFNSQIDWWLLVLLYGAPLALLMAGGLFRIVHKRKRIILMVTGSILTVGFTFLVFPCHYTLGEEWVTIRCGIINHEKIAYTRIDGVEVTRDRRSAPALSLNRVKIRLNKGVRIISPESPRQFIMELRNRIRRHKSNQSLDSIGTSFADPNSSA